MDASLQTIGRYYHHAASGLELALYRGYDAGLGRWISEDPIEERGGLNLQAFVRNNPVSKYDANGLIEGGWPLFVAKCLSWLPDLLHPGSGSTVPDSVPRPLPTPPAQVGPPIGGGAPPPPPPPAAAPPSPLNLKMEPRTNFLPAAGELLKGACRFGAGLLTLPLMLLGPDFGQYGTGGPGIV